MHIGYFSGRMLQLFPDFLGKMLSPFDLLWVFLAVGAAYRGPAPKRIQVS